MKKSRTRPDAGEARACPPLATVQLPLPLLDILADTRTAFFGLCLEAGQQVLLTMMEMDRTQLCGPAHVPDPQRRAYRHGKVAVILDTADFYFHLFTSRFIRTVQVFQSRLTTGSEDDQHNLPPPCYHEQRAMLFHSVPTP